jgi:hypothetical protein
MANKTYRTANGKQVDIETLSLQNETVIAVGNMSVNARGDQLGAGGKIVRTREEVMKEHYAVTNSIVPNDDAMPRDPNVENVEQPVQAQQPAPVHETPPEPTPEANKIVEDDPAGPLDEPVATDQNDEWVEDEDGNFVRPEDAKASTKGISDALATSKSVSVPMEQTPKQKARAKKGIKRI